MNQCSVSSYDLVNIQLNLIYNAGGIVPNYILGSVDYLADLGLNVKIENLAWDVFINRLSVTKDYDLAFLGFSGGGYSPDMRDIYTENGSLNIFGLDNSIPYIQTSEDMQNEALGFF